MKNNSLTVCSVYHSPETRELLELNFDLTKKYNTNTALRWIAVDNSLSYGLDQNIEKKFDIIAGQPRDTRLPKWAQGSYHHAGAINDSLKHVKTRFALFLDSDFYIIRRNWINDVIRYMTEHNLSFFGAPYYPSRFTKYRYFPCAQCLFIDCSQIEISNLDFQPKYPDILKPRYFSRRLKKINREFWRLLIGKRMMVGTARDTGYKVFESCGVDNKLKFESVKPVFKLNASFVEKFLPERLCLVPKKTDSYSLKGFKEFGYFDAASFGWEEYVWRNAPFAVHLQMNKDKKIRSTSEEALRLRRILGNFDK